jgi:small subunit ribosomal protein S7
MARRRVAEKREPLPDPKFRDTLVTKFINVLMLSGKKSTAEHIFYGALDLVAERSKQDPLGVFKRAMDNVKPVLEVKSRRVGGSTYQVPVEVRPDRRQALSARWIVQSAKSRSERTMRQRLAGELLDASNNTGVAIKKKEDTHKMAEANKAFAHYRW